MTGGRRPRAKPPNAYATWSQGANNARSRILDGIVMPRGEPAFTLHPRARLFCLGPRFARQMQAAMATAGLRMLSDDRASDDTEIRRAAETGFLDIETPAGLQQALDWAAEPGSFPFEALAAAGDTHVDPHLSPYAARGGTDALLARRGRVDAHMARAFRSDLVLIVLSTTEAWFDRRTKKALHGPPLQILHKAQPDRYSVRRLAFDEVLAHLKGACARLRGANPTVAVAVAVSPEPIERTYFPEDVIVANAIAKSTLHAAAATLAASNAFVDYFPAYEAVTTSDPARAWLPDRRTVAPEMVSALATDFVSRFGLFLRADSRTAGRA